MLCLLFFWANAAVPLVASVHAAAQDAPPASLPAGEPVAQAGRDTPSAPRAIDAARVAPTAVTDTAAAVTPVEPLAAQARQSGGAAHATLALAGAVDAPVSDGLALGVGRRLRWQPVGVLRLKTALVQNDPNVQFIGRADGFSLQNARVGVRGCHHLYHLSHSHSRLLILSLSPMKKMCLYADLRMIQMALMKWMPMRHYHWCLLR